MTLGGEGGPRSEYFPVPLIDVPEVVRIALPGVAWDPDHSFLAMSAQGQLIACATEQALDAVRGVVSTLRENQATDMEVEARLVEFRLDHRDEIHRLAGMGDPSGADEKPGQATLGPLQAQVLLARIGHLERGGGLLAHGQVVVPHAQRACFQHSPDPGPVLLLDVSDDFAEVRTGLKVEIRAIHPGPQRVRIAGTCSTTARIPLEGLPSGANAPRPGMDGSSSTLPRFVDPIPFNVEMGDGETLVIDGGTRQDSLPDRPTALLVLITVRAITGVAPAGSMPEEPVFHQHR